MKKSGSMLVSSVLAMLAILFFSPNPDGRFVSAASSTAKIPMITLKPGDKYFTVNGKQSFIFSRNIVGFEEKDYTTFFDQTKAAGGRLVRIQPMEGLGWKIGHGMTNKGEVDEAWAAAWDRVIDKANGDGLYVIPVFSSWFAWNNSNMGYLWKTNPLNKANGGPCSWPNELYKKDSVTQTLWLNWMKKMVLRWRSKPNILAWEIFSELNLVSGASEKEGVDFVERAAAIIRESDPAHRPLTASLSEYNEWPGLFHSSIDFIQIHIYPQSGELDTGLLTNARLRLKQYNKPVMLGESGLSAVLPDANPPTLTTAEHADVGIRHSIWAAMVSGTMNGRMLYWEDSYGICFKICGWPFVTKYADLEHPAAEFVKGVDFSGFNPLNAHLSSKIRGAVLGHEKMIIGWCRDSGSEPPVWRIRPIAAGQTVTIELPPGAAAKWQVDFYRTDTGKDIISSITAASTDGKNVVVTLPDFSDDIAFKMTALP